MGSAVNWQRMGERAAEDGEDDTTCPYSVGGVAFKHWMIGYRREADRIEEYLRDMLVLEDLQNPKRK